MPNNNNKKKKKNQRHKHKNNNNNNTTTNKSPATNTKKKHDSTTAGQLVIHTQHLLGHTASVTCLSTSSTLWISGAEDGTVRVWHMTLNNTTTTCMACLVVASSPVTAIAMSSSHIWVATEEPAVIWEYPHPQDSNHKHNVDEPNMHQPQPRPIHEAEDEINQLSVLPNCLCAAEDTGLVTVLSLTEDDATTKDNIPPQQLHHHYNNDNNNDNNTACLVLCCDTTTITTKNSHRTVQYLATGTSDCTIRIYRRTHAPNLNGPLCQFQLQHTIPVRDTTSTSSTTQLCNPPMIHSVHWNTSTTTTTTYNNNNNNLLLAAAVGDGSWWIVRGGVVLYRMDSAHSGPVASLQWLANATILCTVGNDQQMALWDVACLLPMTTNNDTASSSSWLRQVLLVSSSSNTTTHDNQDDDDMATPTALVAWSHPHKPNALITVNEDDNHHHIIVADTSSTITQYTLSCVRDDDKVPQKRNVTN